MPTTKETLIAYYDQDGDYTSFGAVTEDGAVYWRMLGESYIAQDEAEEFLEACLAAVRAAKEGA